MRAELELDDDLVARAMALSDLRDMSALVHNALKVLIERESARRLARLGGSQKRLIAPPRRRPPSG